MSRRNVYREVIAYTARHRCTVKADTKPERGVHSATRRCHHCDREVPARDGPSGVDTPHSWARLSSRVVTRRHAMSHPTPRRPRLVQGLATSLAGLSASGHRPHVAGRGAPSALQPFDSGSSRVRVRTTHARAGPPRLRKGTPTREYHICSDDVCRMVQTTEQGMRIEGTYPISLPIGMSSNHEGSSPSHA
ncbi:hypothetical protein FKP32DRAFT_641424 [Trametes sanguinea]|nr:hypothetical protein FKP32DRAFT_641424 [Trametes sanguinea]